MTAVLATLFTTGVALSGPDRFVLMLPLCLSIAVVYKSLRCERMRDLPRQAVVLWITIVAGMYAVGFGLWAVFEVAV